MPKSTNWHRWFAWYPVSFSNGSGWVWLRYVERQYNSTFDLWDYAAVEEQGHD